MPTITLKLGKRADGRFQKKIDGKLYYFGHVGCSEEDATALLLDFLKQRAAGRKDWTPSDGIEVAKVADHFAAAMLARVKDGDLQERTFKDYDKAIKRFIASVGRSTLVANLGADHFKRFRKQLVADYGTYALDRYVQGIRTMFTWAHQNRVIASQPFYGDQFGKSTASERAAERLHNRDAKGDRVFSVEQIRILLKHPSCTGNIRTFILLGLNAGMYSADISDLNWGDIRERDGVLCIDTHRAKTGVIRRAPLWPECAEAIAACKRGKPGDAVFLTYAGNRWNQHNGTDSIQLLFQQLKQSAGIVAAGASFGALKHTHISNVSDHGDLNAARMVRGHRISGIEVHYDFPSVKRLKAVTDLARSRFLSTGKARAAAKAKAPRRTASAKSGRKA
jgi:integrase